MKKKTLAIAMGLVLTMTGIVCEPSAEAKLVETQAAQTAACEELNGDNIGKEGYAYWASTIGSYLCDEGSEGLMRVQYDSESNQLGVSYYNKDSYQLEQYTDIAVELPVFGGFYEGPGAYFVVSGQNNPDESDETEVIRITKYDKQWNRIASSSLYGANTYEPFEAGSLRMTDDGTYLFVKTCHTMYAADDGKHHQANVTIQADMNKMEITDSYTGVSNIDFGYVSHSFNQFIRVENGNIITVDHGDAYPRSICLIKYNTDASQGSFVPDWNSHCDTYDIISIPGRTGDNYTGASVGGFEISDTSYLIAGNNTYSYGTQNSPRNVFIAAVSKETKEVTVTNLTSYEMGDSGAATPHLISLNNGTYLMLWSSHDSIFYTQIDGDGKPIGEVMQLEGNLSDCVPILSGNKVLWYTIGQGELTFYEIPCDNLADAKVVEGVSGHHYVKRDIVDGVLTQVCDKCGDSRQTQVVTEYKVWWNTTGPWESYSSKAPDEIQTGEKLYFWASDYSSVTPDDNEFAVDVSDDTGVEIEYVNLQKSMAGISFANPGTYTLTIYPKMNPDLKTQTTIKVVGEDVPDSSESLKPSENPLPSEVPQPSERPDGTVVLGDYNGDGTVNLLDAQGTLKIALNIIPMPENVNLDVDHDGQVSLLDAQMILKAALYIITLE